MKEEVILITWWLWDFWYQAVIEFEKRWYRVVIVDNLSNGCLKHLRYIAEELWYAPDFYEIDVRDESSMRTIFEKYNFDWVVHLVREVNIDEYLERFGVRSIFISKNK